MVIGQILLIQSVMLGNPVVWIPTINRRLWSCNSLLAMLMRIYLGSNNGAPLNIEFFVRTETKLDIGIFFFNQMSVQNAFSEEASIQVSNNMLHTLLVHSNAPPPIPCSEEAKPQYLMLSILSNVDCPIQHYSDQHFLQECDQWAMENPLPNPLEENPNKHIP